MKRNYTEVYPIKCKRDYFISFSPTDKPKDNLITYSSEAYRLSHLDLLSIIRLCYKERRLIIIGRKIMQIYLDSAGESKDEAKDTLKRMGITDFIEDGSNTKNGQHR